MNCNDNTVFKNSAQKDRNVFWQQSKIDQQAREKQNKHKAHTLWFTGLSGAGKSTVAREVEAQLFKQKKRVYLLDGDNIRSGLSNDLSFTEEDRQENIRRIGHVSRLLFDMGTIVLCAFISPNSEMRDFVRNLFPENGFSEIYLDCSVDVCQKRDVKGLYKRARAGEIPNFTGISAPYDKPLAPELILNTDEETVEESVQKVLTHINSRI